MAQPKSLVGLRVQGGCLLLLVLALQLNVWSISAASSTRDIADLSELVLQRGWPPCSRDRPARGSSNPISSLAFAAARLAGWDVKLHVACLIDEVTKAAATASSSSDKDRQLSRRNHLRRLRVTLADYLVDLGEPDLAEAAYKQAAESSATSAPQLEDWHQLGWFPIGAGELDSDPVLEAFGNLTTAAAEGMLRPEASARKLVSEFSDGSRGVQWQPVEPESNGVIRLTPNVPWAELVNSLGSTAALEFQGWLIGGVFNPFEISDDNSKSTWTLVCDGPAWVIVDDVIDLAADRYMRGRAISPVAGRLLSSRRGAHLVAAKIRGKQAAAAVCRFAPLPAAKSQFRVWPPEFLPDLWLPAGDNGPASFLTGASALIAFPLVSLRSHGALRCRLDGGNLENGISVKSGQSLLPNKDLAPGQLGFVTGELRLAAATSGNARLTTCTAAGGSVLLNVQLSCEYSGPSQAIQISLRCRKSTQSVLFTFADHDGSVQRAAAVAPLEWQGIVAKTQQSMATAASVPIVVSLHGTSIKPEDQADSHKYMEAGQDASAAGYRFGVSGAWLLAPSRHGAHNWEGPGALTALGAVAALAEASSIASPERIVNAKGVPLPMADPNRLVFLGHSMGGHGALVMTTHWPGRTVGVASLSGWLRKEDYGDNNVFFRHDLSNWQASPRLKSIFEAANAENYVDSHLMNIKALPIFLRVGGDDRVVPPYFLRRLSRQLANIDATSVSFDEVPGQGHWWWDTKRPNDGGVMNDERVQEFLHQAVSSSNSESSSCLQSPSKSCSSASPAEKYQPSVARQAFTLATYNPALMGSLNGFRIERQLLPSLLSKIQVPPYSAADSKLRIATENVLQFSIDLTRANFHSDSMEIDGQTVNGVDARHRADPTDAERPAVLQCYRMRNESVSCGFGQWKCQLKVNGAVAGSVVETKHYRRAESQLGPMRRVAERPFAILYDPSICPESLAVFLSNQFHLTSDTPSAVLPWHSRDKSPLHAQGNFIFLGAWNSTAGQELQRQLTLPRACLLKPLVDRARHAAAFVSLVPALEGDGLALAFLAADARGLRSAVVSLAAPTIPPMARSPFTNWLPDYLVLTGVSGGPGAVHCAGYYDNDWRYRAALASCVCLE